MESSHSTPPSRKFQFKLSWFIVFLLIVIIIAAIFVVLRTQYDSPTPGDNAPLDQSSQTIDPNATETQPETVDPAETQPEIAGSPAIEDNLPRTDKGYIIETRDGVTYIDGILIVNKSYPLPADYGNGLTAEAEAAFANMRATSLTEGIDLTIVSGFRSYATQNWLYERYAATDGYTGADRYSARPGYSEHQSGLAMDLNWVDDAFADTSAGQWLHHHAWEYGFILRYPEGSEDIAGFIYEPWHYRYVGRPVAEKLYNGGDWITLEEYYGFVSKYID